MRVGIISKQRVVNYGSFLQAFGLKNMIEDLGHSVHFIDYRDENGSFDYASAYKVRLYWCRKIYRKFRYPNQNFFFQEREHLFKKELPRMLGYRNVYADDYQCDVVVVGSDEIFNICEPSAWGKTLSMLGYDTPSNVKLISYAGSFGNTTVQSIQKANLKEQLQCVFSRYESISVRDRNSADIIEWLLGVKPMKNLDPVLVFDFTKQMNYKTLFNNYIVVYGYDNRINEPEIISEIKKFAKEKNLKIIALGMEQKWCDQNYLPHPFELLSLFRDANYIITDTFHGTVFSIKFQKQFVSIVRDNNQQKMTDLLASFNLLDRAVSDSKEIAAILNTEYDKKKVVDIIAAEKVRTYEYLKNQLKE